LQATGITTRFTPLLYKAQALVVEISWFVTLIMRYRKLIFV